MLLWWHHNMFEGKSSGFESSGCQTVIAELFYKTYLVLLEYIEVILCNIPAHLINVIVLQLHEDFSSIKSSWNSL